MNSSFAHFKKHWHLYFLGSLVANSLIGIFNAYIHQSWTFNPPFSNSLGGILKFSPLMILLGLVLCSAIVLEEFFVLSEKKHANLLGTWILSWVIVGTLGEALNATVFHFWSFEPGSLFTYLILPYLNISLLLPLFGWPSVAIFTYVTSYALIKLFRKIP